MASDPSLSKRRTSAAAGITSQLKMSSFISYPLVLLLLMQGICQVTSGDSQNDDLREYLGRVDEKVKTLMSIVSQDRSFPPLPVKTVYPKDLPNVHPWRSLDEPTYGQVDQWQESMLARHRQQQESSDYSNDQQILKQISREVDKITLLVKSLNHPVHTLASGGRASRYRYSQDESNRDESDLDSAAYERFVKPDRREELRDLLQDLDRTLKVVEHYQEKDHSAQSKAPAVDSKSSGEDQGELELMKLLEENNNKQSAGQKQDDSKPPEPLQNAQGNKETNQQAAADPKSPSPPTENKQEISQNAGNKEDVRKTLARLMADMKDLEKQVSSSSQLSQAQQLHDRILQLAEKLGNPPR